MFTVRWRLFRVFGMPIRVDATWLIILGLVTWMMAGYVFGNIRGLDVAAVWGMSLATALLYFVCILLHELGHAIVARMRGMSIRGITLFLLGGVAELGEEPRTPGSEFWMAIAGPAVTAVLTGLFAGLLWLTAALHGPLLLHVFFFVLAVINALVLVFNMIPAFPLDGGRVLRSALWGWKGDLRWATYWAATLGTGFGYALLATAVYFLFFPNPYFGLDNVIWAAFIGWFVIRAARASYEHVVLREALQGKTIKNLMHSAPFTVSPDVNLRTWVREYVRRYRRRVFPVTGADGRLAGVISTRTLAVLPKKLWSSHTVADVMRRNLRGLVIGPEADAMTALARMQQLRTRRLLVAKHGRLLGMISIKDLLTFVETTTTAEAQHQQA